MALPQNFKDECIWYPSNAQALEARNTLLSAKIPVKNEVKGNILGLERTLKKKELKLFEQEIQARKLARDRLKSGS